MYQGPAIGHQQAHKRTALWAEMGMGKTISTATTLAIAYLSGEETRPTLVLAPKRVAQSTWPDEIAKWEHLRGLEVSVVLGTPEQRLKALRDTNANVFTTNYENVPWLVHHFKGKPWPFARCVSDESTRLKGFRGGFRVSPKGKTYYQGAGGERSRALGSVAHHVDRFYELTGTPSPNGLADLWGQLWFLDAGKRLGRTHTGFKDRFFKTGYNGHTLEPLPFAQEQIEGLVADLCMSLEAKDYFDLREPIVNPIYVKLPPKARALYQDMERSMFLQIGAQDIEAFGAADRTLKCLQLASGAVYTQPDVDSDEDPKSNEFIEVHDAKIEALASLISELSGAPLLVAYHFKSDLARLLRAFPQARHLDDDPQTIRDWNAGRIPVLLAHPASAGHGLNLQDGGHHIAFFSHWWDLELYMQILERIGPVRQMQSGYNRPVFVHLIVAEGTMDEEVIARREAKKKSQSMLMSATNRSKKCLLA